MPFEIERVDFTRAAVDAWARGDGRNTDWPVVYILDNLHAHRAIAAKELPQVYVGESRNAVGRMRQHLSSKKKNHLTNLTVVFDGAFNKSACLDLESQLIGLLAGDGAYKVLNGNYGVAEGNYYDRALYRESFREVFEKLARDGVFSRSIPDIENSDLFKLSPFKALVPDQAVAVEGILEGLFQDLRDGVGSTTVVQGDPGTGKTVVGIYLMKLLMDIKNSLPDDDLDSDSRFAEFFVDGSRDLLSKFEIALVVPQQSLRDSIKKVFRKTPGLRPEMVMTAFDVGASEKHFDLLIVDEAHRLNQRANQPSGVQNQKFKQITETLFGSDDTSKTQLDWIRAKSTHQIILLDAAQSVRPADLPTAVLDELVRETKATHRHHPLATQMRVQAGANYVSYIRRILGSSDGQIESTVVDPEIFEGYDLRMFDSVAEMHDAIREKDAEIGLARLVAGFAWPWKTKTDKSAYDMDIDGVQLRWNSTQTDWIASPKSLDEVGSIHTVQGYDLNYAGVIIGPDVGYDKSSNRLFVDRKSYFDKKGKENNAVLGKVYTDDDLLRFVRNIYAVLLTRGIRGTYVYVSDPALRAYLRPLVGRTP
jgi:DUF2075 family protein